MSPHTDNPRRINSAFSVITDVMVEDLLFGSIAKKYHTRRLYRAVSVNVR